MKKAGIGILMAALLLCGCNQNTTEKEGKTDGSTDTEAVVQTTEEAVNIFVVYCQDPLTAEFCRQFKQEHSEIPMRIVENTEKQLAAWERGMDVENGAYPDLVAVSSGELETLAKAGLLQPVSDVGITEKDTAQMYDFMKEMGMAEDTLYGLTWQQTAVKFLYQRNLVQKFLDVEDGEGMQNAVGEWTSFYTAADAVAQKSNGKVKLLDTAEEMEDAILSATPAWYVEDTLHIPDVFMDYMELYPELLNNQLTWGEEKAEDTVDKLLDGTVAGCFANAYFIRQTLQQAGAKEGDWGICYGPQTYAEEAVMLAIPVGCSDPALAQELLKYLTCDQETMEQFALAKTVPVNHKEVMDRLVESEEGKDPLLKNQNIFREYTNAASRIPTEAPTEQDILMKELFLKEMESYFSGKRDIEQTLEHFAKIVEGL